MQQDNPPVDIHRQQLVATLGQAAESLRNAATMAEGFAALVQALPVGPSPQPSTGLAAIPSGLIPQIAPQSMFQVLTPSGHNQDQAPPGSGTTGRRRGKGAAAGAVGASGEGEDGRKRKRRGEKKQRDPDAPKRPPSAYLLFQNEVRKEMQALYPDRPYHEVLSKIAARWSAMNEENKKVYLDLTAESKAQFEVAKAAYDAKLAGTNGTVHTTVESVVPIATPMGAGAAQQPVQARAAKAAAGSDSESDEEDVSEPLSPVEAKATGAVAPESSEGSSGDEEEEEEEEEPPAPPPAQKKSKTADSPAAGKSVKVKSKASARGYPTKEGPAKERKGEKSSKHAAAA